MISYGPNRVLAAKGIARNDTGGFGELRFGIGGEIVFERKPMAPFEVYFGLSPVDEDLEGLVACVVSTAAEDQEALAVLSDPNGLPP